MVLLISLETLKREYVIDDNLEDKYILSNIKKCQDFIIEPLLGDDKFNEIVDQITNNTVTVDNDNLIKKYIQPVIAYYVMSEVVYSTAYKMKNAGLTEPNTERFNELVRISKKYLNDSDHYQQLLKDYMCDENIPIDAEYRYKQSLYLGTSMYGTRTYKSENNLPNKPNII